MIIELFGIVLEFSRIELIVMALFAAGLLIQLFFWSLIIRFILSGKKKKKFTPATPSISIVIPSRNYAEQLQELLPVLLTQKYDDYEVVVVDDCSTDGTDWLLAGMKLRHGHLKTSRIIQETDFPNALAITIGVRASSKEWLLFLNPLCKVPDDEWLANYASTLKESKQVSMAYMHYNKSEGSFKNTIRIENFNNYLLSGAGRYLGCQIPVNEFNIGYRREKFLELRGFAAVLDSPFSENECYINKISTGKNSSIQFNKSTTIQYLGDSDFIDVINYKKKQLLLRRKFSFAKRLFLFMNIFSRLLLNASFVALMILSPYRWWILGIWGFFFLFENIWMAVANNKVKEKIFAPMLVIYNIFLPFINIYFVLNQLFGGQKRKWK